MGPTVVTGIGVQCANDAPDRDPDVVVLEGSKDTNLTSYESGTWMPITTISNIAAGFTARFESQEFFFPMPFHIAITAGAWKQLGSWLTVAVCRSPKSG